MTELEPGETEVWRKRANRTQGWRALGGRIVLTDRRLLFEPHALDRNTGGRGLALPLAEIRGVSVAPRTWHPLNGGMRKRLAVETADGTELFVVNGVDEVARRVADAAG
jgi:hypothetical protein